MAMLDMAMASMLALALWQWALACQPHWADRRGGRVHLVLAGLFFGLSLGGKWNGAPLMVVPGLLFAWQRAAALDLGKTVRRGTWPVRARALWQWLITPRAGPVRGVSLIEAALWLGLWQTMWALSFSNTAEKSSSKTAATYFLELIGLSRWASLPAPPL